jgi:hypothetical protein
MKKMQSKRACRVDGYNPALGAVEGKERCLDYSMGVIAIIIL